MRVLHIVLALALTNLPTTSNLVANAEGRQQSHIVIAADHSGSMHLNGNIRIQTAAIVAAVNDYVDQCVDTQVTYVPWGKNAQALHTFQLGNRASRHTFMNAMNENLQWINMGFNLHIAAMRTALELLPAGVDGAVIFITDEIGLPVQLPVPPGTLIFKVSLGAESVAQYLQTKLLPEYGFHRHADTADELQEVIEDVFKVMGVACVG
jgi:hypothetical protein